MKGVTFSELMKKVLFPVQLPLYLPGTNYQNLLLNCIF